MGAGVGSALGLAMESAVGSRVSLAVGDTVGEVSGSDGVGKGVGWAPVGDVEGAADGGAVGAALGADVGDAELRFGGAVVSAAAAVVLASGGGAGDDGLCLWRRSAVVQGPSLVVPISVLRWQRDLSKLYVQTTHRGWVEQATQHSASVPPSNCATFAQSPVQAAQVLAITRPQSGLGELEPESPLPSADGVEAVDAAVVRVVVWGMGGSAVPWGGSSEAAMRR